MADFESNYPRIPEHGIDSTDIEGLRKNAKLGLLFVNVQALAFTLSMFLSDEAGVVMILIFIVAGLALSTSIATWVTNAHHAVCAITGTPTRIPSILLGILSGIPYLLYFMPLMYALDFLIVRSRGDSTPTMRWYSLCSKSWLVNQFAVMLILYTTLIIVTISSQVTGIFPVIRAYQGVVDWIAYFSYLYTLIVGVKIVWQVNKNIEALVERQFSGIPLL